ncbi:MAG: hypothetical protein JXR78_08495, partial [Victivallales bacterium]|nr:hypothetical protein [Victivallales bacterium]
MQLDVQWFIAALVSEELMTREDCLKVLETVGLEADISEVAQEALNLASQSVSEDEAEELLEPFETAAEYAVEQAESGEQLPEDYRLSLFGELLQPEPVTPEPPKPATPDLAKILADPGRHSESSGEHKSLPSLPKPKLDGLKTSNL